MDNKAREIIFETLEKLRANKDIIQNMTHHELLISNWYTDNIHGLFVITPTNLINDQTQLIFPREMIYLYACNIIGCIKLVQKEYDKMAESLSSGKDSNIDEKLNMINVLPYGFQDKKEVNKNLSEVDIEMCKSWSKVLGETIVSICITYFEDANDAPIENHHLHINHLFLSLKNDINFMVKALICVARMSASKATGE